ncbi:MAG: FxLYD domain-containing protein [Reyranellaceae bacterium]
MAYVEQQEAEPPAEPVLTDTRPVPDFVIRPQNHDELVALPAIPPERGMPIWLKVTLGLVILIGLVGAIGYAMRDTLTGPPTAPPVPAPPVPAPKPPPSAPPPPSAKPPSAVPALMPDKVKVELIAGAEHSVMISGEIVNISDAEATPRRLRFTFLDKEKNTVGEKSVDLEPDAIPALGRRPFRQRIDDPPAGAADVKVTIEPLG